MRNHLHKAPALCCEIILLPINLTQNLYAHTVLLIGHIVIMLGTCFKVISGAETRRLHYLDSRNINNYVIMFL